MPRFRSFAAVLGEAGFPSVACVGGFYMNACEPPVARGKETEQMARAFPWDPAFTFG